jgi:DNA polymerase III alpha subunit (gram-positive type)
MSSVTRFTYKTSSQMNTMKNERTTWFVVDIECNGPVPALYDMVSIGAVVMTRAAGGQLNIGETFYIEIQPQAPRFDARAAAIHGLDQDKLKTEGVPRREAMIELSDWVHSQTKPGTSPTFVAHNAPFDWSFISWAYAAEELDNPFGYKALCTKSMSAGVLNLHWLDTNKETLSERLKLPAEDMSLKHRADYDAQYQALILKGLLELQEG